MAIKLQMLTASTHILTTYCYATKHTVEELTTFAISQSISMAQEPDAQSRSLAQGFSAAAFQVLTRLWSLLSSAGEKFVIKH